MAGRYLQCEYDTTAAQQSWVFIGGQLLGAGDILSTDVMSDVCVITSLQTRGHASPWESRRLSAGGVGGAWCSTLMHLLREANATFTCLREAEASTEGDAGAHSLDGGVLQPCTQDSDDHPTGAPLTPLLGTRGQLTCTCAVVALGPWRHVSDKKTVWALRDCCTLRPHCYPARVDAARTRTRSNASGVRRSASSTTSGSGTGEVQG